MPAPGRFGCTGLAPGEPVEQTGAPLTLELGPGLLGGIFDGIARPLKAIQEKGGAFIPAGLDIPSLDEKTKWDVQVLVKKGEQVQPGQIIAQCSKLKGAYQVIVVDVLEGKLDLAKSLGADIVINSNEEDPVARVKALTGGRGADVVVEAAGTADSFNAASAMIRHNGKFVFYSWVTTPITLNISRWHDDGLEFVNTCLVHHTWQQRYVWVPDTLRPIIQGSVKIKPLITNEFSLADIKAGFDLADKDDAAIKIVFRP